MDDIFSKSRDLVEQGRFVNVTGRIVEVAGMRAVATGVALPIGSLCEIRPKRQTAIAAQIVALRGDRQILMTLHEPLGVQTGDPVSSASQFQCVPVGRSMLGCVLDGLGRPIGEHKKIMVEAHYPVYRDAPPALMRRPIQSPLATGIRCIDAMLTLGAGQRLGIFAGTGVGKSVLMGMAARETAADVIVVSLVGERGREVGDFIRKDLGEEGFKRCVLVISTSDESPVLRVRAGFVATAVAEYFRDLGRDVLLMMDSTTRIAMAQREIGLAAGEPPTTKGYPPSVYSLLPKLLERTGRTPEGSITGIYTVLVEGDDLTEPVSDTMRGILDGHIWLSRDLANRGHYPAISVLESISRVMPDVVDQAHVESAAAVRSVLAVYHDIEDLVNVGAYATGTNTSFDVAVQMKPKIDEFLRQRVADVSEWNATREGLETLAAEISELRQALKNQQKTATQASAEVKV